MSIIKFKLKKEHVLLVKHLEWEELTSNNGIVSKGDGSPLGGLDHYEDMGVILYGMPKDFDPFDGNPFDWTEEQKSEMDVLIGELPLALEVILKTQTFEPGDYKCRFHIRNWKKVKVK
tara:strand:+ start:1043 stop:1396 length:354 start_codon:yes stop_codon:yes gene_type:complete